MRGPEPMELRVLAALADGARTPADVQARLPVQADAVLEWAVANGYAERLDLPGGPSYSLTPRGLQTVALDQQLGRVVDASGHVDFAAATHLVMDGWEAAKGAAADEALREQADWIADDGARDRMVSGLADAYAKGVLSKDELDRRTGQALAARTMGELRAAGAGAVELPPVLPRGVHAQPGPPSPSSWQPQIYVNPRLKDIRWGPVGAAVGLALVGLMGLLVQPLVGLALIVVAVVVGVIGLVRR